MTLKVAPTGIIAITFLALWILYFFLAGTWNPAKLVLGKDKRPSTSKLQWFLWTLAGLAAYVGVVAKSILMGVPTEPSIPEHLLQAMGLSAATMAIAKAVTVSYVSSGKLSKPTTDSEGGTAGGLLTDDDGMPDLSKLQMMAWTLAGLSIYFVRLYNELRSTTPPHIPDIDATIVLLTGLSHAGYLGKKLVSTDTQPIDVKAASTAPRTEAAATGTASAAVAGAAVAVPPTGTGELAQIDFSLAERQLLKALWPAVQQIATRATSDTAPKP